MGGSLPSQPSLKPECTLLFCSWIEVDGWFSPPIGYTISRRYAERLFWLLFRPRKVLLAARGERAAWHPWSRGVCEVKEEDGVPYTIQAHEQMVVKVGLGTFELKGAE